MAILSFASSNQSANFGIVYNSTRVYHLLDAGKVFCRELAASFRSARRFDII